jgi:23S rRNA pseudouridine1911/1915/1917 synthase
MTTKPEVRHVARAGPADAGARLDKFLADSLTGLSRTRIKALIEAGRLAAGEATIADPSHRVKPGQRYVLSVPAVTPAAPRGQAIELRVAYEDADLIVIDKPAGMVVHPAPGHPDSTLVNALIAHCGASLSGIGGVQRPGIVHRLDKDTSGLIVAAKNDAAHAALAAQFATRTLTRAYQAVVWGIPNPTAGEIVGNIGRSPTNRKKMAVLRRGGRPATTLYRVRTAFGGVASLIEARLKTGRTHQLRVHLGHRGNPVLGDPLYGRAPRRRAAALPAAIGRAIAGFRRQALHAYLIEFRHPRSGERRRFESDLPDDMAALIAILAAGNGAG